jgi:hypothetical protein
VRRGDPVWLIRTYMNPHCRGWRADWQVKSRPATC